MIGGVRGRKRGETPEGAKPARARAYERSDYPVHSYCDVVPDPLQERTLIYVEAVDPSGIGLDKEVDRLLLYEVPL